MDHGLEVVEDLVPLMGVHVGFVGFVGLLVFFHLECHLGYDLVDIVMDVFHDHFEPFRG